jgi:UrcA family protein
LHGFQRTASALKFLRRAVPEQEPATMRRFALVPFTAAIALTCAAPAVAQTVDEVIVTGQLSTSHLLSLSETVTYAALDLTRHADRDRLRQRVNVTARRLCTRLNQESPGPANMGRSCQEAAVRDAMGQVRQAFADAGANAAYVDTYGAPVSARAKDYGPGHGVPYDD